MLYEVITRTEDADQLELFVTIDLFPAVQPVTAGLDALIRVQLDLAQEAYGRSSATYASTRMRGLGAIFGGVAAGFLLVLGCVGAAPPPSQPSGLIAAAPVALPRNYEHLSGALTRSSSVMRSGSLLMLIRSLMSRAMRESPTEN